MDRTVRALTDLCTVDDQLSEKEALLGGLALALEERRTALRKAIPGFFLDAYDALDRIGRRPVLVQVHGAHCGGCYLRLPPQLEASIRRRQSLCPCPHCRRLLYASPRVAESERAKESKRELEDQSAIDAHRIAGSRAACQDSRAAKRRRPRTKDAHRAGDARRTSDCRSDLGAAEPRPKTKSTRTA